MSEFITLRDPHSIELYESVAGAMSRFAVLRDRNNHDLEEDPITGLFIPESIVHSGPARKMWGSIYKSRQSLVSKPINDIDLVTTDDYFDNFVATSSLQVSHFEGFQRVEGEVNFDYRSYEIDLWDGWEKHQEWLSDLVQVEMQLCFISPNFDTETPLCLLSPWALHEWYKYIADIEKLHNINPHKVLSREESIRETGEYNILHTGRQE